MSGSKLLKKSRREPARSKTSYKCGEEGNEWEVKAQGMWMKELKSVPSSTFPGEWCSQSITPCCDGPCCARAFCASVSNRGVPTLRMASTTRFRSGNFILCAACQVLLAYFTSMSKPTLGCTFVRTPAKVAAHWASKWRAREPIYVNQAKDQATNRAPCRSCSATCLESNALSMMSCYQPPPRCSPSSRATRGVVEQPSLWPEPKTRWKPESPWPVSP